MSSHLIPTPRTDKNGNTVIRHMKPEGASPAGNIAIPPVQVTQPQTPEERVYEIAALIVDPEISDMSAIELAMYLEYMEENNPKTLHVFKKCLTTGSESAQETVKAYLHTLVETIKENIDSSVIDDEDDEYQNEFNWADNCPGVWYPIPASHALGFWNSINVMTEVDPSLDSADHFQGSYEVRDIANRLFPTTEDGDPIDDSNWDGRASIKLKSTALTDAYWRGIAAVKMTGIDLMNLSFTKKKDMESFAKWAGKHEDIATITRLARERGTFNKETLEGIMAEQKTVSSAVKGGTL